MTAIEEARQDYLEFGHEAGFYRSMCDLIGSSVGCAACHKLALWTDAASIALDMAVAAEHDAWRPEQVAW